MMKGGLLNFFLDGQGSWHAIKSLFNLYTIPDSQGQVSSKYRVVYLKVSFHGGKNQFPWW